MIDSLQEYCRLQAGLYEARKSYLKSQGISKEALKALEYEADALMTGDKVETEYGTLQRIPDKDVQWKAHRLKDGIISPYKKTRLQFIAREK